MKRRFKKSTQVVLVMTAVYSAYLLKTLMGINLSNSFSASWILKAPIDPVLSHKSKLCTEFHTACTLRRKIKHKLQKQLKQVKQSA